jgi:HlyD family secretion protein
MTSEPTQGVGASDSGLPRLVVRPVPDQAVYSRRPKVRAALRRLRFLPFLLLLPIGGIIGLYFQPPGLQAVFRVLSLKPGGGTSTPIAVPAELPPTRSAGASESQRGVVGLGKLVPAGDVTVIAPPFGAADARIAALMVEEGTRVAAGDLLAILDNEPPLRAALDSARTIVASREAVLEQTLASVRASRDEARAALDRATASARNAQRELERIEPLHARGVSTTAAFEQRRTAREEAMREVEKAAATLSRWESVEPMQQPDVVVAQRNLDSARAEVVRAERDLDRAHVRAPVDGTVLTIHTRVGEKPSVRGILNLGNIDRMTIEIEVYQSRIGAVAVGDAVEATAEARNTSLKGRVTRIGLEVGRQVLTDPSPAANTDARVVKVHAELDPASSLLARRYTNLQVVTRIAVSGQR